jgi:hypothetical protein
MGDAKAFKSGRECAAWLGLVPGQVGTGDKVRLLGISKRGDTYLRTLLIHGARAVLAHAKEPSAWVQEICKRRPPNVVTVALANKMARTIWALLAHDRQYEHLSAHSPCESGLVVKQHIGESRPDRRGSSGRFGCGIRPCAPQIMR